MLSRPAVRAAAVSCVHIMAFLSCPYDCLFPFTFRFIIALSPFVSAWLLSFVPHRTRCLLMMAAEQVRLASLCQQVKVSEKNR